MKTSLSTFIGETTGSSPYPVFFDPHFPILNNYSPVTLVTGSPGSGKTFFLLTLLSHASILGKTNFVIDYKGDFVVLKKLYQDGIINQTRVWSVLDEKGEVADINTGVLDPTCFSPDYNTNMTLTMDIIKSLIGNLTAPQENSLIPVIQDVCQSENRSFNQIIRHLERNQNDEVRKIGIALRMIMDNPISKLLARGRNQEKSDIFSSMKNGTVVINLMGLPLPKSTSNYDDLSTSEKIGLSVMYLVTLTAFNLLTSLPKNIFKTLIVDEAWAILATKHGRKLITETGKLGRSMNIATIIATQSTTDMISDDNKNKDDFKNTISTRFAFKNTSLADNITTCSDMKLPSKEGWENLISELDKGICLMQDCRGNKGVVQIMVQDEWENIFDTNPLAKMKRMKEFNNEN